MEDNILVAKFLDFDVFSSGACQYQSEILTSLPEFDSDWNWIMKISEKIVDTIEISAFEFTYRVQWCEIRMNSQLALVRDYDFTAIEKDGDIKGVYSACVEFIKWYNNQKQ
jgi:hypothetical protein